MYSAGDHPKVGFPHSEIYGSKPARSSPYLIAACHVLHRLSVPRHPRNALKTLDRIRRKNPALLPTNFLLAKKLVYSEKPDFTMSKSRCQQMLAGKSLQRSNQQGRIFPERTIGGANRDRTDDLKLAKLALSQLSYGP